MATITDDSSFWWKLVSGGAALLVALVSWVFKRELTLIENKMKAHESIISDLQRESAVMREKLENEKLYVREALVRIEATQDKLNTKLDLVLSEIRNK